MNKQILTKQKGITLIALIVTIVVLLILAGISVSTIKGDNGVIVNASKAKFVTEVKDIEEQIELEEIRKNNGEKFGFGTLETFIGRTDGYNEILSIENKEIVYESEKVSDRQAKWLEDMDIHEKQGIIPIYTTEQLKKIGTNEEVYLSEINQSFVFGMDGHYVLQNNINLNGSESNPWVPIGTSANAFTGIFDGNNYIIDGIYIKDGMQGIFCYNLGKLKNIVTGGTIGINGIWRTGIIVAVNKGEVDDCINNCKFDENNATCRLWAGICFQNYGSIKKCINKSKLYGDQQVARNMLGK